MAEIQVEVWGEHYSVAVRQQSKTVWIARGTYQGELHETKGRTARTAAAQWREWARYKGND